MIVVGIDPGLNGACAFINARGEVAIADLPTVPLEGNGLVKRRLDGRGFALVMRQHCPADEPVFVACEAVHAMAGKNNALQTQAALVGVLRAIEAVLDVLRLKPTMVQPQTWQAFYGLRGKKTEPKAPGQRSQNLRKACALYPAAAHMLAREKDHNKAEGLLIAHYARERLV